jgi:hypothetical protein
VSTAGPIAKVVSTLDADVREDAALAETDADRLREVLGERSVRWVAAAVEQSLSALRVEIEDSLAPWSLIRSFAQHVLATTLLRLVVDPTPPPETEPIDHNLVEDVVARDIALEEVTRVLRSMQREWLSLLIDAAVRVGPDGIRVIPSLVTSVTETMDAWIGGATEAVVQERRRVFLAEQVRIRSAIESLVAAEPVEADAASQLLRIPLTGSHLGCAIGVPPGATIERRVIDGVAQRFEQAAGGGRTLRHETRVGTVHLWVSTPRAARTPVVEDLRVPAPLLVGIGEPHAGVDGFRRTFVEASDALRLAVRLKAVGGVSYGDVALAIVLVQDEERARWFVDHELRELAGHGTEMADMRNTLRTFFETRMRIAPAAERLFLHRNTLINRLERIQAVLQHGVAERTAETQAALVLAELYEHDRPEPGSGRRTPR